MVLIIPGGKNMRRKDREISLEEAKVLLHKGRWGVLSTETGGVPYGVPVNYYYSREENAIFIHCAKEGKKLDNINKNSRVSFVVVTDEKIIPEKFTSLYSSVIISGRASFVNEDAGKTQRLKELCDVLTPGDPEATKDTIKKYLPHTAIVRIDIEEISGKRNSGLKD
jgi:uncharacterized protein